MGQSITVHGDMAKRLTALSHDIVTCRKDRGSEREYGISYYSSPPLKVTKIPWLHALGQ